MPTETLNRLFLDKLFIIPPYQRDYAWTERNIDELLEDLSEAIEGRTTHYIGAFVFSKSETEIKYKVVDGQQRLTTLTMLISVLTRALPVEEIALRGFFTALFLKTIDSREWKLTLSGQNQDFFIDLLQDNNPPPTTPAQKKLVAAYNLLKHCDPTMREKWCRRFSRMVECDIKI
jgi:uncharacterized protein with ParB-like and HNH nuclease domain